MRSHVSSQGYLIQASYRGEFLRYLTIVDCDSFRLAVLQVKVMSTVKISFEEKLIYRIEIDDSSKYRFVEYRTIEQLQQLDEKQLERIFEEIVKDQEILFVDFLNKGKSLSQRASVFLDLKGIGQHKAQIIQQIRAEKPFESFQDFEERTKITGICKILADRLMFENSQVATHRLFVRV